MEFQIKPTNKFDLNIRELIRYNELFYFFAWRDIKIKYKQTFLGVFWVILQPVIMTLIFTFSFGLIFNTNLNNEIPYPVFVFSGIICWNVFSNGLLNSSSSMINNANIIKKVYFPRIIIPVSSILVTSVDFIVSLIVFFPFATFYDCHFKLLSIILVPLAILTAIFSTLGIGLFISALNVKYRDFRYILPFAIQAILFLTPVIYPLNFSKTNYIFQSIMSLNPVNAPINIFRYCFIGTNLNLHSTLLSLSVSVLFLMIGFIYFRKTENYFADII